MVSFDYYEYDHFAHADQKGYSLMWAFVPIVFLTVGTCAGALLGLLPY